LTHVWFPVRQQPGCSKGNLSPRPLHGEVTVAASKSANACNISAATVKRGADSCWRVTTLACYKPIVKNVRFFYRRADRPKAGVSSLRIRRPAGQSLEAWNIASLAQKTFFAKNVIVSAVF